MAADIASCRHRARVYGFPRHGTGLFGMLLTRHGLNENARWTRREHWVLHDKMIIGLDDEDMQQMLLTKLAGNNPADLIQQRIEDFRLRI
jgi:hypothetical protein